MAPRPSVLRNRARITGPRVDNCLQLVPPRFRHQRPREDRATGVTEVEDQRKAPRGASVKTSRARPWSRLSCNCRAAVTLGIMALLRLFWSMPGGKLARISSHGHCKSPMLTGTSAVLTERGPAEQEQRRRHDAGRSGSANRAYANAARATTDSTSSCRRWRSPTRRSAASLTSRQYSSLLA